MNTLLRRFTKAGLKASTMSLKKTFFNFNYQPMSTLNMFDIEAFGAKKVPAKASSGGNKVPNVSTKKTKKKKEEEIVEEVTEEEPQVVKKKAAKGKKKAATKVEEEETIEEEEVPKKVNKKPQKATHTLSTQPTETKQKVAKQKAEKPVEKKKEVFSIYNIGQVHPDTPLDSKRYTQNPKGIYEDYIESKSSIQTKQYINAERAYLCNNYGPLPVICKKAKGIFIQDVDDRVYVDFLSAYSALNHGHTNLNIINAAILQMNTLQMTSRAFYNDKLCIAGHMICNLFKYEKVLFMNSGVEAGESAIKIARRWGYADKKIPDDKAKVIFAKGNFWGRSLYACGSSDDPSRYQGFGPFDRESCELVEYGNIEELKAKLEDTNVCAVMLEPIQGENGVVIPPPGYLEQVSKLCKEKNVLLILDEIQTGIGRAGYLLASHMDNVHADIVLLGKSLSGGLYPISAVLASKKIMDYIKPGEHGSTYGGNPLAAAICEASLKELFNNDMIRNSYNRGIELGLILREELSNSRFVKEVRGRGLMYAIELRPDCGLNAYDFSLWLMERGILCKPTKEHTMRYLFRIYNF